MATTRMAASTSNVAAMGKLTVTTNPIATSVATQGGVAFPDEHVLQGEDGVRGGRNTTGQRSGHPFGEIARRVPGEMAKQVAAQIAGYGNKGVAGDPTGNPPQQVVRGDQRRKQQQAQPCIANAAVDVQPRRKRIHQKLDTVLRAH